MNVITHTLLPALLATPLLPRTSSKEFFRAAGIVALGGALPDLLNPHLSLAARYASWTHSIFALAGFGVLLVLVRVVTNVVKRRKLSREDPSADLHRRLSDMTEARGVLSWRLLCLAWLAFGLHLFGDAVSGGIAFFRPVSAEIIRTHPRWIPHSWWLWCDLVCITAACVVALRMANRLNRKTPKESR